MEDHTKALVDLTAAIAALTTRIGNLHPVVLDLQGWKPTIKKSMEELSREVNDMHTQISDEAPHGDKVKDAATLPVCLADLPPLLPRLANTPHPHQGNLLPIRVPIESITSEDLTGMSTRTKKPIIEVDLDNDHDEDVQEPSNENKEAEPNSFELIKCN
ncbi:hypothetical protein D1007_47451 [Hordeum vulgare]|nr:hypothetical protein D1007_47451 [Hordeum vulgare]